MPSVKPSVNKAFGRLLSMAVSGIALYEGKTMAAIEDELGAQAHVAGTTIQRYKAGHIPPEPLLIELLAEAGVTRGRLSQRWLEEFLAAAWYPAPTRISDRLFPPAQARPRPPRVCENLPAPTYNQFVRRAEAFAEVMDGLHQRSAAVVISGLGGNGKTSLVREVATHCLHASGDEPEFDAAVWVSDKDNPGTTTLSKTLDEIARTLGYPGFVEFSHDEKLREIGQLLRHQRVLLIVDNFETVADRALADWLLRLPEPSKVLITSRESRRELRGGWPIELRGMREPEAQELIAQRLRMLQLDKKVTAPAEFEPLVAVTGGNPKAIEIALGLVKHERRPLQQVIDDLLMARGDLFDDLFARAWMLLEGAERRIAMIATLFPGSASGEALAVTADTQGFSFHRAIERLTDLSLLDVEHLDLSTAPRYLLHPLVRAYMTRKLGEEPEIEVQARRRWCSYFIDFLNRHAIREKPSERYWNSLSTNRSLLVIHQEWQNLQSVLEWVDQHGQVALLVELMIRLVHFMDRRGLYEQRLDYARKAAEGAGKLARQGEAKYFYDAAVLYIDATGYTLIQEGRFEEAISAIHDGLDWVASMDMESADTRDLNALGHAFLAWVYLQSGQYDQAIASIGRAKLDGCRAVIRHRVTMIRGEIAQVQGHYAKAIELLSEAAEYAWEYGGEDPIVDDLAQMLGFTYLV